MNLKDFEDTTQRRVRRIRIGRILSRAYDVPIDSAAALEGTTMARGTILPGESASVTAPRVKNIAYAQSPKSGCIRMIIEYIQPEAY